ncbi:MAG: ATP-binding protein [Caldilineaceae bacterium]|nr:ATP-binding protein [Caldilineaceae bacterium]
MLTRIYVNNFRCLVNFEINLSSLNLLLGANGVGKSTLFDVISKVQMFAFFGMRANQVFFSADLTKWQSIENQIFELEFTEERATYRYELAIHFSDSFEPSVLYERLWYNDGPLLRYEHGEVQLYHDDFRADVTYPLNAAQSVLTLVPQRQDKRNHFRQMLNRMLVVQIAPTLIKSVPSENESRWLNANSANFVSWYRYLSQNQGLIIQLTQALQQIIDGFSHFSLMDIGENRRALIVHFFADNRRTTEYGFYQLSDGQCALIVLYAALYAAKFEGVLLCIDEPENFLALPEIQPWLTALYDQCHEENTQAILISHHPRIINDLANQNGFWLDRQHDGPVRVRPIAAEDGGISIAQLIERGWLYDD